MKNDIWVVMVWNADEEAIGFSPFQSQSDAAGWCWRRKGKYPTITVNLRDDDLEDQVEKWLATLNMSADIKNGIFYVIGMNLYQMVRKITGIPVVPLATNPTHN